MRNILLTLAFDGTRYHGFQPQKNALSVCEAFQDAVEGVFGRRYDVKGCSRTDAGVHARMYCLSMKIAESIPCDRLVLALNRLLPADIAVLDAKEVPPDFHARYSCTAKQYVYRIYNSPVKDPFSPNLAYRYARPLDEDRLDAEAGDFVGTYDFTAFKAANSDIADTVRTITKFTVERQGKHVLFTVTGDGFLYNMVRIMVGTLMEIAEGKIARDSIPGIIASRDRGGAGRTMPACGLYLNKVFYGESHEQSGRF